ncbi:MAG: phosphodiesterase [Tepidisphaera sp.]|nr:phosphodiesterase [Tepidisphaera sp.]
MNAANHRFVGAIMAISGLCVATPALRADLVNGVAAGETSPTSVLLWAHSTSLGTVTFQLSTDPAFGSVFQTRIANVTDGTLPVKRTFDGLAPNTRYYYRVTDASGDVATGTFKTPATTGRHGFHMGVSGDWRGELAPFPALRNVASKNLDMWYSLGDTIYGDVATPDVPAPQATTLAEYRAKHNENLRDHSGLNAHRDIRQSTSVWAMIDDHEVTNDFAGGAMISTDPRFTGNPTSLINTSALYQNGLQAFQEYHPISPRVWSGTGDARVDGRPDLYRTVRFGDDAQFFAVDERSFRDQELADPDISSQASIGAYLVAAFNPARTMLGLPQLARLESDLLASQQAGVTWKFVMMPEPIENLGPLAASDRYEGYAAERSALLAFIKNNNITNVVFITADIHGTVVNNVTYNAAPFQPQIQSGAWEISTGPGAYFAPFGPTVAGAAEAAGLPGTISLAEYLSLPHEDQEGYIAGLINAFLYSLGYDTLGLSGSPIPLVSNTGGWTQTNTFGWTEFQVDAQTQQLCLTTWGVPYYDPATAAAAPQYLLSLQPQIVQQICVDAILPPPMCNADVNQDGVADQGDVDYLINVIAGGENPTGIDPDFNRDGVADQGDIDALVNVIAGGVCP